MRRILLLAGEESGLFYAGRIRREIAAALGEEPEFRGFQSEGFATADLAVMGIWPVLKRLFYFLGVARRMKRVIREWRPHAVVTIDYPGMNLKLAAYARSLGIPAVHVVCPQVWAWHRGRIPKIAASLTKLLCFFPFEPLVFPRHDGFEAKFIGHPLVDVFVAERGRTPGDDEFPAAREIAAARTAGRRVVALLPGSRRGEIERILPRQLDAARMLHSRGIDALYVIPAASPRARRQIDAILSAKPVDGVLCVDGHARDVLRAADAAAVASGTATLESALARTPTVLVYATTPSFAWFLRYFVTGVRFAGLANIIDERCRYAGAEPPKRRPGEGPGKGGPMPELLQEEFTPQALADLLGAWLADPAARADAVAKLDGAMVLLRSDGDALGLAAREIVSCL